jgi:Protein of unknown function (DUF1428)
LCFPFPKKTSRLIGGSRAKPEGFGASMKLKSDEVAWFSWIVYKSRKHRDRVNAKVMKDPRMAGMMNPSAMPFDGKRHDIRRVQGHGRAVKQKGQSSESCRLTSALCAP